MSDMETRRVTVVQRKTPAAGRSGCRLLTVAEAGEHVRLSRTTLYGLMNAGRLPFVKIGKSRRIALAALVEMVESNTRTAGGGR